MFSDGGVVPLRELLDEFMSHGQLGGPDNSIHVGLAAVHDILEHRPREDDRILHHNAHLPSQVPHIELIERVAVGIQPALLRTVESKDKMHQRGFAGSVRPRDADPLIG